MPAKKQEVLTEEQVNEEIIRYTLREKALRQTYQARLDAVAETRGEEAELREAFRMLEQAFTEARGQRFDIISDFTRQYKATEDELIARCTDLDNAITDLKDQKELAALALTETVNELEHYTRLKNEEIDQQASRMKEMGEEFEDMLSETQNRMSEAITNDGPRHAHDDGDDSDNGN
jgi:hypothetical protein